jgi:hypothetical protein
MSNRYRTWDDLSSGERFDIMHSENPPTLMRASRLLWRASPDGWQTALREQLLPSEIADCREGTVKKDTEVVGGEEALLDVLARIVNASGRAQRTSAEAVPVANVPVGLLFRARALMEYYACTELTTDAVRHAADRIWD